MRRAVGLTAVALLALPSAAQAGTISYRSYVGMFATVSELGYDAAPGEDNRVTVAREGNDVVIHDGGATVTGASTCTQRDPNTAACPAADLDYVHLLGGDGNDALASSGIASILEGGPGDDALDGGPEDDILSGGGGIDALHGGGGNDRLSDSDGAPPDADVIDGGPGVDLLTYESRAVPGSVDLAAGTSAEGDRVSGIENLKGSDGEDVLAGDAGPNEITGGKGSDSLAGGDGDDRLDGGDNGNRFTRGQPNGADRLAGGGGNDVLTDFSGANVFDGGPGDDEIVPYARAMDDVGCGAGQDTVRGGLARAPDLDPDPYRPDLFARDCEVVTLGDFAEPSLAFKPGVTLSRADVATVGLACGARFPSCRVTIAIGRVAQPFHPLARRSARFAGHGAARVPLGRRAGRALRAAGRVELAVSACRDCGYVHWTVPL